MEELLSLVVSDPVEFDDVMFAWWLEGKTPEEALAIKIESFKVALNSNNISASEDDSVDRNLINLYKLDILDQYRMFEVLEHYVSLPSLLSRQTMIQLPVATQQYVIECYYQLDDVIVREMLSRKLSKNRKDLDEISEISGFPLRRVTREFGNLRRIATAVEERQCNILNFVEQQFALPTKLARRYTCLLFLINGKFNLATKKKMLKIKCSYLELCGAITMACLLSDRNLFYYYWR